MSPGLPALAFALAVSTHTQSVSTSSTLPLRPSLSPGGNEPFSANLRRLCASNSLLSSPPSASCSRFTVASLRVRANARTIGLSNRGNAWTSRMAFSADETLSKTTNACPFAFSDFLATMSRTLPYWLNSACSVCLSGLSLMLSSRLRT